MMLKNDIEHFVTQGKNLDDLSEKISGIIKSIVKTNQPDIKVFENYFGRDAFRHYLNASEFRDLNAKVAKDHESMLFHEHINSLYSYTNTVFLKAALFYVCFKGNLKFVTYLIEVQKVPADLKMTFHQHMKYLCDEDSKIEGSLFDVAVDSGNLDMVTYLYEQTPVMIESTFGQPIEETPLMRACKKGQEDMIEYLINHGAHVNAEMGASGTTPLSYALKAKHDNVIRLLVNAGAIVTAKEVREAIILGLDAEIIAYLLNNSVEQEDPYNSYLMEAIESGNVTLLKALELHPLIVPFSVVATFDATPLEKRMLVAAAKSGKIEMLRHLKDDKKIDIAHWFNKENQERLAALTNGKKYGDMTRIQQSGNTILYAAVQGDARQNQISMLRYLFEEFNAIPGNEVLKEQCTMSSSMKTVAYLYSHMHEHQSEKELLLSIAYHLESLELVDLFRLYNCRFIQTGNEYEMHGGGNYSSEIASLIKQKLKTLQSHEVNQLITDRDAAIGALFYFSTNDYDKKSDQLIFLLTKFKQNKFINTIDVLNCKGESLALYAARCSSYHIVHLLLDRGANPDLPDEKGETLINKVLNYSYPADQFEWIKIYADKVNNSLLYASTRTFGGANELKSILAFTEGDTQGVQVAELLANIVRTHHYSASTLKILFVYLNEDGARDMVRLLRNPSFIEKNQIQERALNGYFDEFKEVSTDLLTSEQVQQRLKTEEHVVTTGLISQSLFAVKERADNKETIPGYSASTEFN